jgi:YNFM family putative membrane transporter
VAGWAGGLFYAAHGWTGVGLFVGALMLGALLIAWRLPHLPPRAGAPSPGTEPALP